MGFSDDSTFINSGWAREIQADRLLIGNFNGDEYDDVAAWTCDANGCVMQVLLSVGFGLDCASCLETWVYYESKDVPVNSIPYVGDFNGPVLEDGPGVFPAGSEFEGTHSSCYADGWEYWIW